VIPHHFFRTSIVLIPWAAEISSVSVLAESTLFTHISECRQGPEGSPWQRSPKRQRQQDSS
jgi:hypothetical protein